MKSNVAIDSNAGLESLRARQDLCDQTKCQPRVAAGWHSGPKLWCILLLSIFVCLQFLLPTRSAVQIGADEGYELAKATLSLHGYKMYTEVWNDQPPLHTFLITQILKHISSSIAGPRLLTTGLALVLLGSIFYISFKIGGNTVAVLTTALLIASPIFIELGSSCMVEIPAMAPALAAIALLLSGDNKITQEPTDGKKSDRISVALLMFAGALLGVSFQIKFINAVLLPLIVLVIWLQVRGSSAVFTSFIKAVAWLSFLTAITFVAINELVDGQGFLVQFKQSWSAHFASAKSFEYGSPADHPFDWSLLLKNWDTALPALVGVIWGLVSWRRYKLILVAIAWLLLSFAIFTTHKPWWACYYLHTSVPLCLCAALGINAVCHRIFISQRRWSLVVLGVFALVAIPWMLGRVALEIKSIRACPRVHTSIFLEDIERFKPFTKWLYTEEPVYSFHAGIPMPPQFAVVALKRLWSGDMTNAKIKAEISSIKPGIMLLLNEGRQLPFDDLIQAEYQPVYTDEMHRLFVHKSVLAKAREWEAKSDN